MGKQKINLATHGLSGKIDTFVYRQRNGITVVSKPPVHTRLVSDAQGGIRSTFKRAVIYAKAALMDADTRMLYASKAKPGQSAFNMAIADFFLSPVVGEINISGYTGQPGSIIKVESYDDFKVASVLVRIEKSNGTLIEDGNATLSGNGLDWEYTATTANGSLTGSMVIITATDRPGHSIVKQKTI